MADEVYECTLSGYLANQWVQTVQHVLLDNIGPATAYAAAKQIAEDLVVGGNGYDLLIQACPEDYKASSLRVRRVNPGGGATAVVLGSGFATAIGGRTGVISSAQANPLIIWIGETEPGHTGRLFVPGVSEEDIDEMQLGGPLTADIQNFIDKWIVGSAVTAGSYTGCIFRKSLPGGDQIEAGRISPLIGTQRGRLHSV